MQQLIISIREKLVRAVDNGDTEAVDALQNLKELSEKIIDLEEDVQILEGVIAHG